MRSLDELVDRMMPLGFRQRSAARRALDAALGALGEALTEEESLALADKLPDPLATIVRAASFDGVVDAGELYERARRRAGAAPGRAIEETQIALRVVAETLDPETRVRIRRALPIAIGALFETPEEGAPPPHSTPARSEPIASLATGRPGSGHPLSEAHAKRSSS